MSEHALFEASRKKKMFFFFKIIFGPCFHNVKLGSERQIWKLRLVPKTFIKCRMSTRSKWTSSSRMRILNTYLQPIEKEVELYFPELLQG